MSFGAGRRLPARVKMIDDVTRDETSLHLVTQLEIGSHYAETLRRWDNRFLARCDDVLALGFDDMFMRVWHFYLADSRLVLPAATSTSRPSILPK